MALDPNIRSQLIKTARLWAFAVVCASVGAAAVWWTDELNIGILAFLAAFVAFGVPLWAYERSRRAREERERVDRAKQAQRAKANTRRR